MYIPKAYFLILSWNNLRQERNFLKGVTNAWKELSSYNAAQGIE